MRILWADYTWPGTDANDIAAKFNAALKLASQCKQNVSMENAEALVAAVDDIATVFWSTKGVEYSDPGCCGALRHVGFTVQDKIRLAPSRIHGMGLCNEKVVDECPSICSKRRTRRKESADF